MATAAIVGAFGYTGQETLDPCSLIPDSSSTPSARTRSPDSLRPRSTHGSGATAGAGSLVSSRTDAALSCGADVVFLCLGHEEAAATRPPSRGVVVDLSGAHRFRDPRIYESWYGFEHPAPDTLTSWSYGLPR